MDLLKFVARRSYLSEVIYVALNVALAVGVWFLVAYFNSPVPAYGLILVSKWRVLSVRPRFWLANIQANAVDILVGFGFATLLSTAVNSAGLQSILTLLFVGWLLYLKPRSTKTAIAVQAGVAQFVAITALLSLTYSLDVSVAVLFAGVIGYAASRHILTAFEEKATVLLSFIWGFVVAELTWVAFHWNIGYGIPLSTTSLRLPQIAIIVGLLGYIGLGYYKALSTEDAKPVLRPLVWPTVIVGAVCLVLLTVFNGFDATSL
jgi:hypothetical protein